MNDLHEVWVINDRHGPVMVMETREGARDYASTMAKHLPHRSPWQVGRYTADPFTDIVTYA